MTRFLSALALLSATCLTAPAASATNYVFDISYSGGGVATLAAGSADPLATTMVAGDTFTYNLSAAAGSGWTTLQAGSIFPFYALSLAESGTRTVDYVLSLNRNGSPIFSDAGSGVSNSQVHLGTNSVAFGSGLQWDQYSLTATILSADTTSTPNYLLPWPGKAPEDYSPTLISFGALGAVPEPATWAMMILGFGAVGFAMRRRETVRTTVRFA